MYCAVNGFPPGVRGNDIIFVRGNDIIFVRGNDIIFVRGNENFRNS